MVKSSKAVRRPSMAAVARALNVRRSSLQLARVFRRRSPPAVKRYSEDLFGGRARSLRLKQISTRRCGNHRVNVQEGGDFTVLNGDAVLVSRPEKSVKIGDRLDLLKTEVTIAQITNIENPIPEGEAAGTVISDEVVIAVPTEKEPLQPGTVLSVVATDVLLVAPPPGDQSVPPGSNLKILKKNSTILVPHGVQSIQRGDVVSFKKERPILATPVSLMKD